MAQSLRKRFEGKEGEVIEYAKTFGLYKAADRFDTGLLSMRDFLETQTGNPDFGVNPTFNAEAGNLTAAKLVDAFTDKICKLQAENQNLRERLNQLLFELQARKVQDSMYIEPKIQRLTQALKA